MRVLRKFGSGACLALLPLFLFGFGLLFSLYQVLGSADGLKGALEKSGAYNTVIENSLNSIPDESAVSEEGESLDNIPTKDPEIRRIFKEAFSPEFLKQQTEGFLDAVYGWLRGEQANLQFAIGLREGKSRLIDGLAAHAEQRAHQLPICDSPQAALNFEAADVFSASCVPPGLAGDEIATQVRREINRSELFEDTVITASDIKNDQGQTLEQQLEGARNGYSAFRAGVYASGVLLLLLIAGAVLLAVNWRVGARRTATIVIVVGSVSALLAWGADFAIGRFSTNVAQDNPGEIVATLANALGYLANDLRNWWLGFGIFATGLGVAALVTLYVLKKRQEQPTENAQKHDNGGEPAGQKPDHDGI